MTEQFACQSYSDDDGILKDCTCGKCRNTPDTEMEKEFDFKAIKEYWGLHVGPKSSQHMQEKVLHKIYLKLLTSRDTYWKERVRKEVVGMKVWFMEEDYRDTFPLISKEDLLDNLK